MVETPGADTPPGPSGRRRDRPSPRTLLIGGVLVLVAFGAGFLWQHLEARAARAELDEVRRELMFEQMGNRLATALIQAEGGAYEPAREQMSSFFTELDEHMGEADLGARQDLQEILRERDAVITALSRSAPESRQMLARLFTRYQVIRGGPEGTVPLPSPEQADTAATAEPPGGP